MALVQQLRSAPSLSSSGQDQRNRGSSGPAPRLLNTNAPHRLSPSGHPYKPLVRAALVFLTFLDLEQWGAIAAVAPALFTLRVRVVGYWPNDVSR
jgi:hypothetical protein